MTDVKMNPQAYRQTYDELGKINAGNIEITKNKLHRMTLRPPRLEELGLVPTLYWLIGQIESQMDIVITFYAGNCQPRFAPDIELTCFSIIQEALSNIIHHAEATWVEIDLSWDYDLLRLSIQDDGCGFDTDIERQHSLDRGNIGLISMQEQAMLINGYLDIYSSLGKGTEMILICPTRMREGVE